MLSLISIIPVFLRVMVSGIGERQGRRMEGVSRDGASYYELDREGRLSIRHQGVGGSEPKMRCAA